MTWLLASATTAYGRHEGKSALALMAEAAQAALDAAGLEAGAIDGLVCGYATTLPHLMLGNVFAEHFGLRPQWLQSLQLGGATGVAMAIAAMAAIQSGMARTVLVVAGENRLTGSQPGGATKALSQVLDADYEQPLGAIIPAQYALLASWYLAERKAREEDLAALAVLMRRHASQTTGAHHQKPLTEADVMASRPIATPLKLLDCCPVSDGAAAFILSADAPQKGAQVRIIGAGQAHQHQHLCRMPDFAATGAVAAMTRAMAQARCGKEDVGFLGIYDSFSITLALLLEELGFAGLGKAGQEAAAGRFDRDGDLPLNPHGGLLSYGHCGVAGGMAHLAAVHHALRHADNDRLGYVHADGGVMSAHAALILERAA
ncbi:MAG: thiolase family protein [Sphingomonadaceae bacterium]|nr:thiolase family protein [Sphingomonadaceae bacterium]